MDSRGACILAAIVTTAIAALSVYIAHLRYGADQFDTLLAAAFGGIFGGLAVVLWLLGILGDD